MIFYQTVLQLALQPKHIVSWPEWYRGKQFFNCFQSNSSSTVFFPGPRVLRLARVGGFVCARKKYFPIRFTTARLVLKLQTGGIEAKLLFCKTATTYLSTHRR